MLGKLMKHELKATKRILIPLYLVLLCISIINGFLFQSGINGELFRIFTEFLMVTQISLIIAIFITTVLIMTIRFYKNLLSDEGYLMLTLPVNTHQLITSKLIITLLWLFISIGVVLSSLYVAFATSGSISLIISEFQRAFAELNAVFGEKWALLLVELILMILIGMVGNILLIYVSVAIGQLYSKHKVIASFVSYAILYNAIELLIVIVLIILRYALSANANFINMIPQVILPVGIVFNFIGCIAFYTTTNYIFKRKLNLD